MLDFAVSECLIYFMYGTLRVNIYLILLQCTLSCYILSDRVSPSSSCIFEEFNCNKGKYLELGRSM